MKKKINSIFLNCTYETEIMEIIDRMNKFKSGAVNGIFTKMLQTENSITRF